MLVRYSPGSRAKRAWASPDAARGGGASAFSVARSNMVAILATDGIRKEPVVVEGRDGEYSIAIHHVGMLVLAWDHRAFDGAYAGSFLNEVRTVLETRDWDAELA